MVSKLRKVIKPRGLSDRDIQILHQLHEKVTLTVGHLQKLCFQSLGRDAAYKVLSRLKRRKLVQTVAYDFGRKGKLMDLHLITKQGVQVLQDVSGDGRCYSLRVAPNLVGDYDHRVAIVDYWVALELDLAKDPDYQLQLFVPEYKKLETCQGITLRHIGQDGVLCQLRSDALFIIRHRRTHLEYLFFLETDRGTMPIQASGLNRGTLETKVQKYQRLFQAWSEVVPGLGERFCRFPGARVVLVTSTGKRVLNIANLLSAPLPHVFWISHSQEVAQGAFLGRYLSLGGIARSSTLKAILKPL